MNMMRRPVPFPLLLASLIVQPTIAQLTHTLDSTVVAIDVVVDESRVNIPWEILLAPDGTLWMTDGPLITRWDPVTDVLDTLLQRPYGNGLGMALHPDFPNTPEVFAVFDTAVYYGGGQFCELFRFNYDAFTDQLINDTVLLTYPHSGEHAGGRLLFDTTGHLLLTTADFWHPDDALFYNRGKTLRVATDGSVPPDNPRPDYTWSWGHRNPQGLAMLPNGGIVNSEHGQATNEINLILPGRNHGWFAFDGDQCTNIFPDSCTSPTFQNTLPIAEFFQPPSGTEYYSSSEIPEFTDKLLTCILWFTGMVGFTFNSDLDSIIAQQYYNGGAFADMVRIRDLAIHPDGSIYLITNDRQDARIRRMYRNINTSVANRTNVSFSVWPNPAEDVVHVRADAPITAVLLHDALGRPVPIAAQLNGNTATLATEQVARGSYAVHLRFGETTSIARILLQ